MAATGAPSSDVVDASKANTAAMQAGGGVPIITTPEARRVTEFSPTIASYAKNIYEGIITQNDTKTAGALRQLWLKEEGQEAEIPSDYKEEEGLTFREFVTMLEASNAIADIKLADHDFSRPLSNYYISSSHNTYLMGNQLYGEATTNGYKNVLLRGCRCVEIDVWDGEQSDVGSGPSSASSSSSEGKVEGSPNLSKSASTKDKWKKRLGIEKVKEKANKVKGTNVPVPKTPDADDSERKDFFARPQPWRSDTSRVEPVVLHGYTATKEIPFREVCAAIGKYAFMTSPLPVIISLEVHTSLEQQKIMVDIMEETFGNSLLKLPDTADDPVSLPAPQDLLKKILIKVKYSPPKKDAAQTSKLPAAIPKAVPGRKEAVDSESNSETEVKGAEAGAAEAPASKMYEALSQLGVYTRSFHFSNFEQPEAKIPTHIFSLSETKFKSVHEKDVGSLSKHNRNFLMRCYPKGLRIQSSNLDPAIFWRHGVQMVALNWQHWDAATMMNEAMFAGSGGYMLKPPGYRGDLDTTNEEHATTVTRYTVDLTVEFFAGQNIPLPGGESKAKNFEPYVKTEMHVETPEERKGDAVAAVGTKAKDGAYRARTKTSKGQDPDFQREKAEFRKITGVVPELSFVRFKVKDNESFGKDELAAWACIRLDRLQTGYRFVHLFDRNGVQSEGVLLVRIDKKLRFE